MKEYNLSKVKVFDWLSAARVLAKLKPYAAAAGLSEAFDYTGSFIWFQGKPVTQKDNAGVIILASRYGTPVLRIYDANMKIVHEIVCYIMGDRSQWGLKAYYPKETWKVLGITQSDITG